MIGREIMKQQIHIPTQENALQPLYSQDWEYFDYGNCKRHLQILFPYRQGLSPNDRFPLILLLPGSAWRKQEMYNDIPQYAALAQKGFVVAAMEYREADIAQFPAQVQDVCNALNFIPTIADNFHVDINNIFLMGNSSGGHIAMMTALFSAHGYCQTLPNVRGVIVESGSTDILTCSQAPLPPWLSVRPSALLLGVDKIEGNEAAARKASCGMYITKDIPLPPVLLFHSEHDPVVSVENSRLLYAQLSETDHAVDYYELTGSSAHGGLTFYDSQILGIIEQFCLKNLTCY